MSRPTSSRQRALAAIVLGIALAGFTWSAIAARGPDDRTTATQILATMASSSAAPAASHAVDQSRRALNRADQARNAGDTNNAKHFEGLAREWAEMARDIGRATAAERRADRTQRAAASATLNLRKTEALLETLVARRARAQAELRSLHAGSNAGISSAALSAALRPPAVPTPSSKASR